MQHVGLEVLEFNDLKIRFSSVVETLMSLNFSDILLRNENKKVTSKTDICSVLGHLLV